MFKGAMSFRIVVSDELKKTLAGLKRKDQNMFHAVEKKMLQIASSDSCSIQHFKNLRSPLSDFKRVHLGSYVLLFTVEGDTITFEAFEHHDQIYQKKS
jgi:mRNA-degrading endonuclease RelE of RelBE toxin-antitoxin system